MPLNDNGRCRLAFLPSEAGEVRRVMAKRGRHWSPCLDLSRYSFRVSERVCRCLETQFG